MFNTNALVVALDFLLLAELWSIALWFTFDLTRRLFVAMAIGFMCAGLGVLLLLPGDIALALGHRQDDFWFLARDFRALPNRAVWSIGFGILTFILRFGRWVK